jgi:hypothetical protein
MLTVISGIPLSFLLLQLARTYDLCSPIAAILHCRHHPRKRMIQYPAQLPFNFDATAYWMPAFAGITASITPLHLMPRENFTHFCDQFVLAA